MWIMTWKYLMSAGLGLALAAGGGAAVVLLRAPDTAAVPSQTTPTLVLSDAQGQPTKARTSEKKKLPQEPWNIAAEFLKLSMDGKTAEAMKLCDRSAIRERQVDEIANSGLKVSRIRMMLLNDTRVAVVTERTKVAVKPGEDPVEGSLVITLERARPDAKWLVRDLDFNDDEHLRARIGRYLDGGFDLKPGPKQDRPIPKKEAEGSPAPGADIAAEFLAHALAGKVSEAVGLTVPGSISEIKAGEIKNAGYTRADLAAVLINDTRVEVVTKEKIAEKEGEEAGHLVIMVTRSKNGVWQVKDLDFRAGDSIARRVDAYLRGTYDLPKKN